VKALVYQEPARKAFEKFGAPTDAIACALEVIIET
jgi:hypothetical protein